MNIFYKLIGVTGYTILHVWYEFRFFYFSYILDVLSELKRDLGDFFPVMILPSCE